MVARLSRHTFLLLVSNVGGAGLSFLLSVLIGRALGDDGLGAYSVVLAWVYPLSLLVEFGIGTLATREVAQDTSIAAGYLDAMARARLFIGGLAMFSLILLAPLLSDDSRIVTGLIISAPLVIILPFYSAFTALFKAYGAMWPIPYLTIGMLLAQVIGTAYAFASGGGILAALVVNTLTSLGQLLAAWVIYRWRFMSNASVENPSLRSGGTVWGGGVSLLPLLRRAWPFALAALFAALQTRLSILLLESLTTTADVGYYAAASRFVEAARMIPNAFFGALFPVLAALAAQPNTLQRTFSRAMVGLSAFGLIATLLAWPLAPPLIAFTYGDAFTPAIPILPILMLSLAFSLLRGGRTLYWYALGREQTVNAVNGFVLLIQLVVSLALIPAYGAVGAALALVLVEAAGLALLWRDLHWPVINKIRTPRNANL